MPTFYLDNSGGGSDSNNGTSWALAKATLAGAFAVASAGDTILVAHTHAETQATALALSGPGTLTAPCLVISVNRSTGVGTAGAAISVTSNVTMTLRGAVYYEGITFSVATGGSSTLGLLIADGSTLNALNFQDCQFRINGTNAASRFHIGAQGAINPPQVVFNNPIFKFGNVSQRFLIYAGDIRINNMVIDSGGSIPAGPVFGYQTQRGIDLVVAGGDFSALGTGVNMMESNGTAFTTGKAVLYGVKMPSGWNGSVRSGTDPAPNFRMEMSACDEADGMFFERADDTYGQGREELVFTRSGGRTIPNSKSGGTDPQPMSIKLDGTSRYASYPGLAFIYSLEPIWNVTVGSSVTVTLPILVDSATEWDDGDIVLVVRYPGAAGTTRYYKASSAPASAATARTALDTKFGSSSGWTTTGMANAKQRQLQVSVTPREKGFLLIDVHLFKRDVAYVSKPTV